MPAINASEKAKEKAELGTRIASRLSLVPVVGLEPTRCCHQRILSPSRLPIPSHRHINRVLIVFHAPVCITGKEKLHYCQRRTVYHIFM